MKTTTFVLILAAFMTSVLAEGQNRGRMITVSGTVTDTMMAPIGGVLIVADGQSTGVTTRRNGTYKLRVRQDIASLGAYTSNMGSTMTIFDGGTTVDFVLDGNTGMPNFKPEASYGDQKVDVGYGTKKRSELTTDVGYIDGQEDINASYNNIYDMIQGRVPGVQVSGTKITIRGINSINSGTDPLFVVDGVVVNSIDHISPRQVRSISVLKGSDASIYGSRGAGGVILITLLGTRK
ncbi:MAG: TonB-dependent receptor plug domain-containing protein [Bacteroidales bacterium]|nr:TonB-dependent receptor plug domain-containing protein [Bacteroidales bacterium]